MIGEIGQFGLILALVVAMLQGTLPLIGASNGNIAQMRFASNAALVQFLAITVSFIALTMAYVGSDFLEQVMCYIFFCADHATLP